MSNVAVSPGDCPGIIDGSIAQVLGSAVQCQCRVSGDIKAAAAADGPATPGVGCSRQRQGARASQAATAEFYIATA